MEQDSHLEWKLRVEIVSTPSESGGAARGEDGGGPSSLGQQ